MMQISRALLLSGLMFLAGVGVVLGQTSERGGVELVGVNLAGADFGYDVLPGKFGVQYTYPNADEVDYFMSKGMNVFRLPFLWERLQPNLFADLDEAELARIRAFVDDATGKGARVILDVHNYARYFGDIVGVDGDQGAVPVAALSDFWVKLATEFSGNSLVILGLMNEPSEMATELWLADANTTIAAIRKAGVGNLILVPGNGWSGAHSWDADYYGTPNSQLMGQIVDPDDNYAIEVHQYLDEDSSGTSETCVDESVGSDRLHGFTQWARAQGVQAFLGEFSGGANARCLAALDDMLNYVDDHGDVWLGWTYWAAGPWWGEDGFTLEPANGVDRPQMAVLARHMSNE
ncbi:MAG: glycoside hydrolase family 5 protein [Paracoccaceae bacterium]